MCTHAYTLSLALPMNELSGRTEVELAKAVLTKSELLLAEEW